MELTLDQALQKGIKAHKAGKAQEADQYYTAVLKANPKHPDANHNMGVLAVGVGKVQEALPFFKKAGFNFKAFSKLNFVGSSSFSIRIKFFLCFI